MSQNTPDVIEPETDEVETVVESEKDYYVATISQMWAGLSQDGKNLMAKI